MPVINSLIVKKQSSGGEGNGKYQVLVVDYDGTILKSDRLNKNDIFTLPTPPTHSGLVFQCWSSPIAISNNNITVGDSDIIIGPVYETSSGLSEFDIVLTDPTNLTVTLNMDGNKDWGDGSGDTSNTHTYSNPGNYTVYCDGSTITSSYYGGGIFGNKPDWSVENNWCVAVRLGRSITTIPDSTFCTCISLATITIPNSVTLIDNYAFYQAQDLPVVVIPQNVTTISRECFYAAGCLKYVVIPYGVTTISYGAFSNTKIRAITIPNSVTSIETNAFCSSECLLSLTISNNVSQIEGSTFTDCYSLSTLLLPNSITEINTNAFENCYGLKKIKMPNNLARIASSAFNYCVGLVEYDFTSAESVPSIYYSNTFFEALNQTCKIKVPSSLYSSWVSAQYWSDLSNHIESV